VINLRANNDAWLAENLAEWVSEYFGHDRVYLLDAANRPVRSVDHGERVPDDTFGRDQDVVLRLVEDLRLEMAAASEGADDSTEAVTGLGSMDRAVLSDGQVGIVSIRPIVPGTPAVTQAPGTEYLHVSIRLLDDDLSQGIADHYELPDLRFERTQGAPALATTPVMDAGGRILGFFTWRPYQPAAQLLRETAPIAAIFAVAAFLLVTLLMLRLRRTSAQLEVSEANARYLAFHDPLARIPNRALFEDRLERALTNQKHTRTALALHSIDLDRFKHVNDTLGHGAGDELIRQVAARLKSMVNDVDTVARLGGDEFAIIQVNVVDVQQALTLSGRIVAELEKPFELQGHEALVSASVGVAFCDDQNVALEDLLRQADVALYEAKTSGRGRYQLFAGELDVAVSERRALEVELRAALNGEPGLALVYQPIYSASSGTIEGAEALIRWNSPRRGRLAPIDFIGLAEERGLIDQLGLWVLREACNYAVRSSIPWIAVNVSPAQFKDERLAERVLNVLYEVGLAPSRLELEITEGLLLQNSPAVQATLTRLRAAGVRIALDDFGTGYSSISYLRSHGVDKIKIDQSYVAQLGKDLEIDNIVVCIIGLAKAMHMKVTAEGVETEDQMTMLRRMGCNELQGYLLARPMSPADLESMDTHRHIRAA
jgi:diguanylate cyclase (GGDEF)-like protein